MKSRLSLATRLALVASASALLYGLLAHGVPAWRIHSTTREATEALLELAASPTTGPALLADCAAHPAGFHRLRDKVLLRAYDRQGRSLSGDGSPLTVDRELQAALAAEPPTRLDVSAPGRYFLGRAVLVTGEPACPLLVAEPFAPQPVGNLAEPLLVGVLLGLVAVLGTTLALGVRPLQRRLAGLAAAAERVGGPEFPRETLSADGPADDLGRVAQALARADARLRADASLLQAQREAVERHLADVAHDVRTPVAALSLIVQAWATQGRTSEAEAALREVAYLGLLLDNLHQDSRSRAALDDQRTHVDAEALVERVGERFRRIGAAHGVQVDTLIEAPGLGVRAHPVGLERALSNLVYNAILHGEGPVLVRLEADDARFCIAVSEAGPGPSDRLLRAPEGPRAGGLGLGLRITREVIAAHGWTLRAASTDGGGAELRIEGDHDEPPLRSRARPPARRQRRRRRSPTSPVVPACTPGWSSSAAAADPAHGSSPICRK